MKHYTSIEQSKRLLELGLNPESADMWYQHIGVSIKDGSQKPIYFPMVIRDCESDEDIPCWSVEALLEVIPKHPKFNIALRIVEGKDIIWASECHAISEYEFKGTSDLECLYNAIVWLLENNYIK